MHSVRQQGGKVLVHCMQGQNRSVTIVAAYLMQFENMSLKQSMSTIRNKRKQVCPFRDNREELIRFEVIKFGVSTMSVDDFVIAKQQATGQIHRNYSEPALTECCKAASRPTLTKSSKGIPPEFLCGASTLPPLNVTASSSPLRSAQSSPLRSGYSSPLAMSGGWSSNTQSTSSSTSSLTHAFGALSLCEFPPSVSTTFSSFYCESDEEREAQPQRFETIALNKTRSALSMTHVVFEDGSNASVNASDNGMPIRLVTTI